MGIIVFNGLSSKDYHIQVEHPPGYDTPEREYESFHVPGRNGDIIISKDSYKNTIRTYDISFGDGITKFQELARGVSEWLHSASAYARLEDSYEPNYYRMAIYNGSISIENILFYGGRATIEFDCKPQRFLKSGDKVFKFTSPSGGIMKNPTLFSSRPIISVYGNGAGNINIGGYVVGLSNIQQSVTINSEVQDCYRNLLNQNDIVALEKDFPQLSKGNNNISFSGGVTSVEVIPKWWTL